MHECYCFLFRYHAYLTYYGESVDYNFIRKYYFSNDDFNYFILKQSGEMAQVNSDIMDAIGLHFCMVKIKNEGEHLVEEKIVLDGECKYSFGHFISTQKQLVTYFIVFIRIIPTFNIIYPSSPASFSTHQTPACR